jgi:DNA-binding transcriptional ArsR family regulator
VNDPTEDELRARIAGLRSAGLSVREIAAEIGGISKSAVDRHLAALRDTPGEARDTERDTPAAVPTDAPADSTEAERTPAQEAAELRHHANELRREACEGRRQVPQILDEAQAKSRRLAARAIQADREADELSRRAIDLEQPQPAIGHRFGRAG